jgi:hypothetical protein
MQVDCTRWCGKFAARHDSHGMGCAGRGGPSHGLEAELLPRMLDFTIRSYFPDIWRAHLGDTLQVRHWYTCLSSWAGM